MAQAAQWMKTGAELVLQSAFEDTRKHFTRPGCARCVCGTFLPRPYTHCVAIIASFTVLNTPTGPHRINMKWHCPDCVAILFASLQNG